MRFTKTHKQLKKRRSNKVANNQDLKAFKLHKGVLGCKIQKVGVFKVMDHLACVNIDLLAQINLWVI